MGDFNVDFNRNSRNTRLLRQFVNSETFQCCHMEFGDDNDYTFEASNGTRSMIDHVFVNDSSLHKISNYSILIDGFNLSDHNPVHIALNSKKDPLVDDQRSNSNDQCVNWSKAEDIDIQNYKNTLDMLLSQIVIPNEIYNCNLLTCKNHTNEINNYLNAITEAMFISSHLSIPKCRQFNASEIPGWSAYVKPFQDASIVAFEQWKQAGRPENCHLDYLRKCKRRQYHRAVNKVKHDQQHILKSRVSQKLCNSNFQQFWKIIKNMKKNNCRRPNVVDGINGDTNINRIFFEKYKTLYNTFNDRTDVKNILNSTNHKINDVCTAGKCHFDHNISNRDIVESIRKLKNNKSDPNNDLNSNNLIYGSDKLYDHLSKIFKLIISQGIINEKFNCSILLPLVKNNMKSSSDSDNYRAISINSIICKLLEYVLIDKLESKLNSNFFQFGFKSNSSTNLFTFAVEQTIQYYINNRSLVYAVFLDASKAFDLVRHNKIFKCLLDKDVCPVLVRLLISMYLLNNALVKWNDCTSENFTLNNGVKQGSILSPLLFSLYIDPLITNIQSCRSGCYMGDVPSNIFGYADDLVLLSPSLTGLKKLISICEEFGNDHSIKFNGDKSKCMLFSNRGNNYRNFTVSLNNVILENVDSFKHLGNHISCFNKGKGVIDIEPIIKDMKVICNILINEFGYMDTQIKKKLFNTHCLCLYGSQLWDLDNKKIERLSVEWRKCCRRVLGLPPRTHCRLIPPLMNTQPIQTIAHQRLLNFI